MRAFSIKQSDSKPYLQARLQDADGDPVDLAGASVVYHMRYASAGAVVISGSVASVTNASQGQVLYKWASGGIATAATYEGEFQVVFSDGSVQTIPNRGYIPVTVADDIA